MKEIQTNSLMLLWQPYFWLTAVGAAFVAIYLTLLDQSGDEAHFGMSALFLFAVGSLLWERRKQLQLDSNLLAIIVGIVILGWVLWQSATFDQIQVPGEYHETSIFLSVMPVVSAVGLGLIASGFRGLKQYWQEITVLFFLGVPRIIIGALVNLSPITAKFSAFLLWYLGFNVRLDGVFIRLPKGSVEVYEGCSGLESITYVLGLSVVCLVMFPVAKRSLQILSIVIAIATGFLVNALRVALMAILVAFSNMEAFKFWHEGTGSLVFGAIAVITFGVFYYFLLQYETKTEPKPLDL
jgi:cyanoexosortase A